jgi:DNA-binding transcriptional ArsR family regulator
MDEFIQPQHCADMLGALAAPERLRIIRFLRDGSRTVGEIADLLQVPTVNASHHLTKLREAGLVSSKKQGRCVVYSLAPHVLQAVNQSTEQLDLGCCRLEMPTPKSS